MTAITLNSLVGFDRLEILRARRVGIRQLPVSLIDRLTSLRVLDVAENEISAIAEDVASSVARLHELNLADNRLVNLSALAELLSWHVERVSTVNLAGNPWHCLCSDVSPCRRLAAVLDTRTRRVKQSTPRCASPQPRSTSRSVLEFCSDLVTASDNNQTTPDCRNGRNFEQRVAEETAIFRTLSISFVAIVLLTVLIAVAYCRLSRRNTRQPSMRTAGSTRRNGYRIVGETALAFTDVQ